MDKDIKKVIEQLDKRTIEPKKAHKKILDIINFKKIIIFLSNLELFLKAILFYLENNKDLSQNEIEETKKIIEKLS